jgi:hypothetical protein
MPDPYELVLGERETITPGDIDFFAQDREQLELLQSRETGKSKRLVALLICAIVLILLSKIIVNRYPDAVDQLISDVFVDFFFERGAALIGAAVTVLLINRSSLKQTQANIELRREIECRIAAQETRLGQ